MKFQPYKIGDTITLQEYTDIAKELRLKWKLGELEPGQPTYFEPSVNLSRRKFKEEYPDTPIVRDLSKAHNYIVKDSPDPHIYFGQNTSYTFHSGKYWIQNYLNDLNKAIDFINLEDKNLVFYENIKFKAAELELNEDMMAKLQSMLQSRDQESFNMGWRILFNHNHEKDHEKFILLIGRADQFSYYKRKKSREIEPKLNYLKQIYKNFKF